MATAVLDLELAQLPVEVGNLAHYEHALVLLRLHGVPVAQATVPVTDGRDRLACVQEPLGCYRMQHVSMVTDSVRTERELMAVLDKFFCHTDLPPQAVADRREVDANWLLWLSFLHYIGARWEAAQRDMTEAVALSPALRQGRLLDAIVNEAFNPRVDDPLLFIQGVIAHLPATVHLTPVEEDRLMGRGYIGLALRSYRVDDVGCAQQQLTLAHRLYHSLYRYQEDFANDLLEYAMSLPTCPRPYLATVFQNLPAEAQSLRRLRARVVSSTEIGYAFEDFCMGRTRQVISRVVKALRHHPAWLLDRGVVSILTQSLLRAG